jgi:hypothetical protein
LRLASGASLACARLPRCGVLSRGGKADRADDEGQNHGNQVSQRCWREIAGDEAVYDRQFATQRTRRRGRVCKRRESIEGEIISLERQGCHIEAQRLIGGSFARA